MNENFYEVKVGTLSKKGNLNVAYSFVCKTDKGMNDVKVYYLGIYKGFDVVVRCVEDIDEPKIVDDEDNEDSIKFRSSLRMKDNVISRLNSEIKRLKEQKNRYFNVYVDSCKLDDDAKVLYGDMLEKRKEWQSAVNKLNNKIEEKIKEEYSPFLLNLVRDQSMSGEGIKYSGRVELRYPIY